jgi:hypothetical protein
VDGKPLILALTEGRISDCRSAATVLQALPDVKILIADKGVEAQPVPPCPVQSQNHTLHSRTLEPKSLDHLRHQNLQATQSDRAHVRQAQGLAPHRHPPLALRPHFHERHLRPCNRHIPVMSPKASA